MVTDIKVVDKQGKTVEGKNIIINPPKKKSQGLFGNTFSYNNAGKYRNRYYTLSDNSNGLDTYSRELLVRWSREITAQLPIVSSAIRALAEFSVDNAYLPEYVGNNTEWGKIATDWLTNTWYPNCCTRGNAYDFQTCLNLFSQSIDTDGDFLQVFGIDNYGFPLFQVIPTNRIKSTKDNVLISEGAYKDCIISDGVVYTMQGKAVGYTVLNSQNMVNSAINNNSEVIFSAKDSRLLFETRYFDKNRGIPSIAPAILQALSIQELDSYLMDKIKIESMVGLIEATPTGEAPQELQNTLQELLNETDNGNGASLMISPQEHAVSIVNGPEIRYVRAEGGDIRPMATSGPTDQAGEYMSRLETQILSTLGVPHQLIFSTSKVSGRVTSAVAEIFRSAVRKRQAILDKTAKFTVGWALAKAVDAGILPPNDDENFTQIFNFTKPAEFSLDARYDNDIIIDNYSNGFITLNDATTKICNKTATEVTRLQADEQVVFYNEAMRVAKETGMDLNIVISNWKKTPVTTTATIAVEPDNQE